tara:strand:+ start:385 stop:2673 length:2289 start_codon:yes stop_codon:yes gene_type:complete
MKLLICESPAKTDKIAKYAGNGYKCVASFGHIRQIENGLKSIDKNNNYLVKFCAIPSKNKYISQLRRHIKNADEVILATDDDREGEAIAWHICKMFGLNLNTTKRIIFHEITKPAIQNAINNPTIVNMDTVNAQLARQVLDLLVGYTISPILWKHISRKSETSLSAGRCQTPALRLVYEQQQEINKSPGRKVYNTEGKFLGESYTLNHNHTNEEEMGDFLEKSVDFEHKYSVTKPKNSTKMSPKPFTTSTLQQKASNEFGYSPKVTMRLAQTLYEGGHITYMRTDSVKYSKEFTDKASKFITGKYGKDYVSPFINSITIGKKSEEKKKKTKKKKDNNAQEAHESIRPTNIDVEKLVEKGKITAKEAKLYYLIWRNTVESCMAPAKYLSITAKITAPEKHVYKHSEEQVVFPGWKAVAGYQEKNKTYHTLLKIKKNLEVEYQEIISKVTLKDLKKNYTEARLVQMLEKKGIGRPSTFSSLVAKIQDRNYVKKQNVEGKKIKCVDFKLIGEELEENESERVFGNEKNKLVITPIGTVVYEFLEKHFDDLFNYDYTKNMEDDLDKISKGEKIWHTLCDECNNQIKTLSKEIQGEEKLTIKIDEKHTYMIGKYGPVIAYKEGEKLKFKSVKKNIDIEKLKRGEYKLKDIVQAEYKKNVLGKYKNEEVVLKNGKYGLYVTIGGKNTSVKTDKNEDEITLEDVIPFLQSAKQSNSSILKQLNENITIRKGKYGPYVFYKTDKMKKPRFINMKGKKIEEVTVVWVMDQI